MQEIEDKPSELAVTHKPPYRSGHWFLNREALQEKADQLVFAVTDALTGKANTLDFKTLRLEVAVTGKGRVMSLAEAIRIARTVQETLQCPIFFIRLGCTSLELAIAHPLLVADTDGLAVRWLEMMALDDWIAGVTAPLQP